jgi:diaminopimelate epimerase
VKGTVFYKMTGSGNDFVVLDGRSTAPERWPGDRIRALCDRRSGIGADGLVILTPEGPESVRMVYWNSDGSRAEMCGNAALCSGRLAADLELASSGSLCLLTDAGPVQVRARAGCDVAEVRMPDAELPRPVSGLEPGDGERWLAFTIVGVPHLVVRVDDVETADVTSRGRALRFDLRLGPAGANVNFVGTPSAGGLWPIRTYERGVEGETHACGTGIVAAGLALAVARESSLPVRFQSRGGLELQVRATLDDSRARDIWLTGQSRLVFRGVWEG